jgi:phosphocarrier protein FPr
MVNILSPNAIRLNAQAACKEDAIRLAGELLVNAGCVMPEYVAGMLARETTMSTYLGCGVSIPHGEYENYQHILKNGISIVQFRNGVVWEEEEKAYLVIGIAASSDEHVGVLSRLAEVIEEESIIHTMIHTDDPLEIIGFLSE